MPPQGIPTLADLFHKWRESKADLQLAVNYFQRVAAGQSPPIIRDSNAIFAAQTMMILVKHFVELEEQNATTQKTTTEESNNYQGQEQPSNSTA